VGELSAPRRGTTTVTGNLTDDVVRNAVEAPDAELFSRRKDGKWQSVTAAAFHHDVATVARGLLAVGLQPGDRIALISRTRYEWTLLDYAIWWVGAVSVPVYATSSADQIAGILTDSGAVACVAETTEHRARVEEATAGIAQLKHLWTIDQDALEELRRAGADVSAETLEERRTGIGPEHLATLIYTSGTTGSPKGCMLTHDNFRSELRAVVGDLAELFEVEGASTLLFLPLAHVFARVIQAACVATRVRLGHSADIRNLMADLAEFQPTFILGVPRVFEKIFTSASQRAHGEGKGRTFDAAATTAIQYSRAMDRTRVGPLLRARHRTYDRLVYSSIRSAMGGNTRYAVSGGAPLGPRLAHFFRGIGLPVLEGYGLTESTAALTVNTPGATRIGTVGRPLSGTSARVADDGELLFKGRQVFLGYWHDEPATHEALADGGWLHTGDVGEVDDDGYVRITGRKKEMLVTAGGKSVAPAALEEVVRTHPLVSHCLVVGEARPFVAALVTLDPRAFAEWRKRHGKRGDLDDLTSDPDLVAEIQGVVDEANAAVSQAESIRKFEVLAEDWTEESGHVTPTLKLKRHAILAEYHEAVQRIYA